MKYGLRIYFKDDPFCNYSDITIDVESTNEKDVNERGKKRIRDKMEEIGTKGFFNGRMYYPPNQIARIQTQTNLNVCEECRYD